MSAISEKVRIALYSAMNVSAVTTLSTGGIHFMLAQQAVASTGTITPAPLPYTVYSRIPADVVYALGNNLVGERDQWLIKALTEDETQSGPELAEDILTAIETAIGTTLTLSGNTVRRVRRVREMPNYIEKVSDRVIYHHGFFLDVFTE